MSSPKRYTVRRDRRHPDPDAHPGHDLPHMGAGNSALGPSLAAMLGAATPKLVIHTMGR